MKIAPGIHRIGDNSMINAYLIEQAGEVTIIDAGVSGFHKDIDRSWPRWAARPQTFGRWSSPMGTRTTSASRSGCAASGGSRCRCTKPTPPWPAARC
jgi:hypothetical protein